MEDLKFKTYSQFKQFKEDVDKGILYIEGYASKFSDNGNPVIDYDGEIVDVRGFDLSTCTTLLFNHDSDEYAVGKCRLEHRPDGAYLYGEIHREMNDKVYYAVKHGIMTDFSIGFIANDYEFKSINGEDVLTFTKGFVFETSIVNIIGANPLAKIEATKSLKKDKKLREVATWLQSASKFRLEDATEIKSIKTEDGCIGFACSIEQLKKANPDGQCSCQEEKNMEKDLSKKDIKTIIKGLTFEETEAERWTQARLLEYYMGVLITTIEDNFWESMWQDDMSGEDYKQNIIGALTAFGERLNELPVLDTQVPDIVEKEIKREIMTKEMETKTSEVVETVEQTPAEEVTEILEGGEKDTPAEPAEPTTEQVEEQNSTEEKVEEQVSEEVDAPVEQSVTQPTVQTIIGTLATVNLDELSVEEIEAIYNTSADIIEKIEALVKADIEGDE